MATAGNSQGSSMFKFQLDIAGVVMHHHLYVIGNKRVPCIEKPLTPVLYKYHFWSKSWGVVELPDTPAATYGTLLAADAKHIFMFGGTALLCRGSPPVLEVCRYCSHCLQTVLPPGCTTIGHVPLLHDDHTCY